MFQRACNYRRSDPLSNITELVKHWDAHLGKEGKTKPEVPDKLLGFGWNISKTGKIQPKRQQRNENWRQTYTYIDKKLRAEAGSRHPENQQGLSHPMVRLCSAMVYSTWLSGETLIASYSFNVGHFGQDGAQGAQESQVAHVTFNRQR